MRIESLHHVSLNVRDLELSRRFYQEILGLQPIERPPFDFPGAWFAAGSTQQLHLIVHDQATFPSGVISCTTPSRTVAFDGPPKRRRSTPLRAVVPTTR